MHKINSIMKILFHIINLILIFFYLYPGSLIGLIFYDNIKKQPQITRDFFYVSSNHFYVFVILTFVGIFAYRKDEKINLVVKYLFLLSIIIELFHFIVPQRNFELIDLFGNILGVSLVYLLYKLLREFL